MRGNHPAAMNLAPVPDAKDESHLNHVESKKNRCVPGLTRRAVERREPAAGSDMGSQNTPILALETRKQAKPLDEYRILTHSSRALRGFAPISWHQIGMFWTGHLQASELHLSSNRS